MRVWLLAATVIICVEAMRGKCGHSARQNFTVPSVPIERDPERGRELLRGSAWSPIRIKVYFGQLDVSSTTEDRLRSAVESAVSWFKSALLVKPITSPWKVAGDNCDGDAYPSELIADSLTDDFVFYVYADEKDNGLAGAATYCQTDESTGQPILGVYYFNGNGGGELSDEGILSTTIHEMTHALVFSDDLYTQYRKADGTRYANSELFVTETVRGMTKMKLALPNILAKARAGFSCNTLNGIELESDGGDGTQAVHWEKRVMYNDYMVADSDITDITYTDVSLALFKDSGWYDVNYKYATAISWGYHEGCGFITQKCVVDSKATSTSFCTTESTSSQDSCDFMHLRKGTCNLSTLSDSIPAQYNYFGSATKGGSDEFVDYCPVVKADAKGSCRDADSVELEDDYGEEAGFSSRCVTGTYSKSGSAKEHAGCHKVTCSGTTATVVIGGVSVTCPPTGGDVQVQGMNGVVHCPASDILCRDVPCINNCYGGGYCQHGQCVCSDGTQSCQVSLYTSDATALAVATVLALGY